MTSNAVGQEPAPAAVSIYTFAFTQLWVVLLFLLYSRDHKQKDCANDLRGIDFYMYFQISGYSYLGIGLYQMVRKIYLYNMGYGEKAKEDGITMVEINPCLLKIDKVLFFLMTAFNLSWWIFGADLFLSTGQERKNFESEDCYKLHELGWYWFVISLSVVGAAIACICCCVCLLLSRGGQ